MRSRTICRILAAPSSAADLAGNRGARGDPLAVLVDGRLLQAVEIAQQVGPLDGDAGGAAAVGEILLQQEREERAEDVALGKAASEEW
jgi:hypothetical protein